ncbi:MAG: malto-oligosyltrehalose synthase [Burkholderiaceae bacterium]|nr:malto-oligosyltrehalose synthase [Burkholderiaceae bacterium]
MPPADASSLQALARRHGIALAYHDIRGSERAAPEATLRALLAAMGVDPAQADAAFSRRVLAPAIVAPAREQPVRISVTLPESRTRETLRYRIVEEGGRTHRRAFCPADAAATGGGVVDGTAYRVCEIELDVALPIGYHRLELKTRFRPLATARLILVPDHCYQPEIAAGDGRAWGPAVQLYALRSERNWGIGDFTDLRVLVEQWAARGADIVGVNPLHALFLAEPERASPYSASSRLFLNPLYLDVESVPDYAECEAAREQVRAPPFQMWLRPLRDAELVDYAGVAGPKRAILETLFAHFSERHLRQNTGRGRDFRAYVQAQGLPLRRFALFEALHEHFAAGSSRIGDWRRWPAPYRNPDSRETKRFAREHGPRIEFFSYLQWQCELQLDAVQAEARARGLEVGLYRDLAVSVEAAGADAWAQQSLYASGVAIGAPPDDFSPHGQNWGLAPFLPEQLGDAAFDPWIETLRRNMRSAGALRIDHVMALWRLFWVPADAGAEHGTYVEYPHAALLGILALESVRNRCVVIGEDLGTVPVEVRATMQQMGILSYRLLMFEREPDGEFKAPSAYPPAALAAFASHDLPTLAGYWAGRDLALRADLDLYPDATARDAHVVTRAEDRVRLLRLLDRESLLPAGMTVSPAAVPTMPPELACAVHSLLARSPARFALVQLEDVLGQLDQVNLPGADVDRHPNWRRKLSLPLEQWAQCQAFATLTEAIAAERPGAPRRRGGAGRQALAIPRATYRLQLDATFGFRAAADVVPYLARLGISHCYCSPFLKARPGSAHGYDVVDHNAFNPELGTEADFERFSASLRAHGMGLVVDVVPNHMGVMGADNAWWLDVLENGPASVYAPYFDVDWAPAKQELRGKLLLPLLGGPYGTVLERGELALQFDAAAGEFSVQYFAHRLPIAPREYPRLLRGCNEAAERRLGRESQPCAELSSLITAFANLPPRSVRSAEKILERHRDRQLCKRRLARLCSEVPAVGELLADVVRSYNGTAGDPRSFDALHELLEAQPYRLADWRAAADEINYRRFFDINDLAAVRVEEPTVFDATHTLVLGLLQSGRAQALRIDHPDGLRDPAAYFVRLQQHAARACGSPAAPAVASGATVEPAAYMVVEKILACDEGLPGDWPVHGTTGYDFLNLVNGVLIDGGAARNMLRFHAAFVGGRQDFDAIVYDCKHLLLRYALASELTVLANELNRISESDRHTRDFTLNRLREAVAEVIACFPVYRTYVAASGPSATDRARIESAIARARRGARAQEIGVFEFLRQVLLLEPASSEPTADRDAFLRFVMRFQQLCAPVMAKGMEDTALYRYTPLVSLCEVGGDPRRFGVPVRDFHDANALRRQRWPHTMLATSTHDSKRSEDVRARINVLTELQAEWRAHVHRWTRIARPHKREVDGAMAPCASDEYLLYQTLVGAWPLEPAGDDVRRTFGERIAAYLRKAAREAKVHTSWINPSPAYEEATQALVTALLDPAADNPFLADFLPFQRAVAWFGMCNSLSQALLKLTCPGVPDFYQGNELWDFSLVDPDNRRPVDYRLRARMLADIEQRFSRSDVVAADAARALLDTLPDGRAKLFLTWKVLSLRRDDEALFRDGEYVPLDVSGERAGHLCAFARRTADRVAVILAPRLYASLATKGNAFPLGAEAWGDTRVNLRSVAPTAFWRQVLTGERIAVQNATETPVIRIADALSSFPVAVLLPSDDAP